MAMDSSEFDQVPLFPTRFDQVEESFGIFDDLPTMKIRMLVVIIILNGEVLRVERWHNLVKLCLHHHGLRSISLSQFVS